MNWNIINKPCTEWSKDDWREAYAQYCKTNMFGSMTKQQYYDFVCERYAKLHQTEAKLSKDLLHKWHLGKIAAMKWAKLHNCDMNGRKLDDIRNEKQNLRMDKITEEIIDLQQKMFYYHENKGL